MKTEDIEKIKEFLEITSKGELSERIRKGKKRFYVDYKKLAQFDPDIAESLIDEPEEILKTIELATEDLMDTKGLRARLIHLPKDCRLQISTIRSKDLNKLVVIEGIIKSKSDVRPKVIQARFECPACGTIISVLQFDKEFKEPTKCTCGRKGKFRLLSKDTMDTYGMVLEELPENIKYGTKLSRLNVFVSGDLADINVEERLYQGLKVEIAGVLKEIWITSRKGVRKTELEWYLEANFIEIKDENFFNVEVTAEDIQKIKKFSKKNVLKIMADKLFSRVYGYEMVKESILLSAFGGTTIIGFPITRGQIHVLLIGEPGTAKSTLLKIAERFLPKSRYLTGGGASAVGLTATVARDELLGTWTVDAGAFPLCHNGTVLLDELDKLNEDERGALHEVLEQLTVSVSKANIQQTLKSHTTLIAAANPKYGRWSGYENFYKEFNLAPALVNRFDLFFIFKEERNKDKDIKTTKTQLKKQRAENVKEEDITFFRKYIAYAKTLQPEIDDKLIDYVANKYVEIKYQYSGKVGISGETDMSSIPITQRQVDTIKRLTEAYCKSRLSKKPTKADVDKAIYIVQSSLGQVALDKETGKIDVDIIQSGISQSRRQKIYVVQGIIDDLTDKLGRLVPIEDIVNEAESQGVPTSEIEEIIQKMLRVGDIYEPKSGFISKLK